MSLGEKFFYDANLNLKLWSGLLFSVVDGGTAWLMQSFDTGTETVDGMHGGVEPWHSLADQLRQDLASIVLMSEADLEVC